MPAVDQDVEDDHSGRRRVPVLQRRQRSAALAPADCGEMGGGGRALEIDVRIVVDVEGRVEAGMIPVVRGLGMDQITIELARYAAGRLEGLIGKGIERGVRPQPRRLSLTDIVGKGRKGLRDLTGVPVAIPDAGEKGSGIVIQAHPFGQEIGQRRPGRGQAFGIPLDVPGLVEDRRGGQKRRQVSSRQGGPPR